jgi:hypothetical protein
MIHSDFRFSLDSFATYYLTTDPGFQSWSKQVSKALRPFIDEDWGEGDFVIDLDSPKLAELVPVLEQLQNDQVAKPGTGYLTQSLTDDAENQTGWFQLSKDLKKLEAGPRCDYWIHATKADRMKPGIDVASARFGFAVSERFREVVEKHRLTGVEFVWIPDQGKYRAPQWYLPIAHNSLGRGLDHPWFDRKKLNKHPDCRKKEEALWRCGVTWFFEKNLRDKPDFGSAIKDRLFYLFRNCRGICFVTFLTVLRSHLPPTDFAYFGGERDSWGECNGKKCKDSYRSTGGRGLCVNRQTRDLLIANKVSRAEDWAGIQVLDKPYKDAAVLDRLYPDPPGPLFTDEEIGWIRAEEAKAWAAFVQKPKPAPVASLSRSLELLKARKRMEPAKWASAASSKAIERASKALPRPLPTAWQKVLRTANGGVLDDCELANGAACAIPSTEELPKFHEEQLAAARCLDPQFPDHFLHVVQSQIGDFICLDTSTQTKDGDCPVLLVSHETGEVEREWDNVATFLDELLASE